MLDSTTKRRYLLIIENGKELNMNIATALTATLGAAAFIMVGQSVVRGVAELATDALSSAEYYSLIGSDGYSESVMDYNLTESDCRAGLVEIRPLWGSRVSFYCSKQPNGAV